jgi:glycosyltransferase involved in cell wall biosynthesis
MTGSLASNRTVRPRIALIAPGQGFPNGQGMQASTLAAKLQRDGFDVLLLPVDPQPAHGTKWLERLRAMDVVHIFAISDRSFLATAGPALHSAKQWNKRVVVSYYNGDAAHHAEALRSWVTRVDDIVVPSLSFQRVFARGGHRARVIPPVVDVCRFHYRKRVPLRPYFLSTRNLNPEHDVQNTLLVFALVRTRYPDATLTIAGTGCQANELWQLSESLGNRGIRFLGKIEPSAMPRLYEEADIFLNSSLVDHQPSSVLEAMASGLPVITTDSGEIALLVQDGISGMIVPRDPYMMAKAAAVMLERPGLAQQIAYRAKERTDLHTWSHIRDLWAAVYTGRSIKFLPRTKRKGHETSHAA